MRTSQSVFYIISCTDVKINPFEHIIFLNQRFPRLFDRLAFNAMISQTATVLIFYPILILTQMIDSSSHLCYNFHEKQTRHKSRARSFHEFARHKDVFGVRLIYTAIRREESYRVLPASPPKQHIFLCYSAMFFAKPSERGTLLFAL